MRVDPGPTDINGVHPQECVDNSLEELVSFLAIIVALGITCFCYCLLWRNYATNTSH